MVPWPTTITPTNGTTEPNYKMRSCFITSAPCHSCYLSGTAAGLRQHELQISDSDRAALDCPQTCFGEQRDNVLQADMTMGPAKMGEKASSLVTESLEINCKHTTIRLQDPTDFIRAL